MTIEMGLLFGMGMFISYTLGAYNAYKKMGDCVAIVLSHMNKDLNGAVEDWINNVRSK